MAKFKPDEKNMHAGHRARVLNSYSQIELFALSPHQVLEFILFYVFPRGDVNPLAHRLLDRFGSVQAVLDASPQELCQVYGISTKSANMLAGFVKIFDYYTSCKLSRKRALSTPNDVFEYCEDLLRYKSSEVLYAITLDAGRHVVAARQLGETGKNLVAVDSHSIVDFLNETHAAYLLLCHSHPDGHCQPTENDFAGNNIIKNIAEFIGVKFVDHLVIGDDGIFSMKEKKILKSF